MVVHNRLPMTPAQEMANALTIPLPTCVLGIMTMVRCREQCGCLVGLLVGSAAHLPVSFAYHLSAALGRYPDRLDNDMRRLDQSMQHASATVFAFALHNSGWPCYCWLISAFNLWCIFDIWRRNDGRRWVHVLLSVLMYTTPIGFRDSKTYALAMAGFAVGGVAFVPEVNQRVFRGWGHALFHLSLCSFAYWLAKACDCSKMD